MKRINRRSRINHRLIKMHRTYDVAEAAEVCKTHKNTVRAWIKQGLPVIDNARPTLIHGAALKEYLQRRRELGKRPCGFGKIFCMKCRSPQEPAGLMVDFVPISATAGNLTAICPICESMMFRRAGLAKLGQFRGHLDITLPQALRHISESNHPSVNSDFNRIGETNEKTQRRK